MHFLTVACHAKGLILLCYGWFCSDSGMVSLVQVGLASSLPRSFKDVDCLCLRVVSRRFEVDSRLQETIPEVIPNQTGNYFALGMKAGAQKLQTGTKKGERTPNRAARTFFQAY